MNNLLAKNFYLNVIVWSLFCLSTGLIYSQAAEEMARVFRNGDESRAVQAIQAIRILQSEYAAKHQGKFAPDFDELIKTEGFDAKFAGKNPVVDGYVYNMTVTEATDTKPAFYSITADPDTSYVSARARHFYIDSTLGTIRVTEENRPATAADPAI